MSNKSKINKERVLDYLKSNPFAKKNDIAEYFDVKPSYVYYFLHLNNIKLAGASASYRGVRSQDIIEYAANHTMKEIIEHFGGNAAIQSYINRQKIAYIKEKNHIVNRPYQKRNKKGE